MADDLDAAIDFVASKKQEAPAGDSALDVLRAEQRVENVSGLSPEDNLRAIRYAKDNRLPGMAVIGNPDVKPLLFPGMGDILKNRPALASSVMDDEDFAAVNYAGLGVWGKIEDTLRTVPKWAEEGSGQVDLDSLYYDQMFGANVGTEIEDQENRLKALRGEPTAEGGLLRQSLREASTQLPTLWESVKGGAIGAGAGAGIALGFGQAGPQIGLPEEIITVPAGATLGAVAGSTYTSFRMNAGNAYGEFISDPEIEPDVARGAALVSGSINAGLDQVGLGRILKTIPGADKLASVVGKKQLKAALQNRQFRQAMGEIGKRYATAIGAETVTETMQEVVQMASQSIAQQASGAESDFWSDQNLERLLEVAKRTAMGTSVIAGVPSGVSVGIEGRRALQNRDWKQNPEAVREYVGKTVEAVQQSDMAAQAPDQSAKFFRRAVEGQKIWLDGEKTQELYKSLDDDYRAMVDAALPKLRQDMDDAAAIKADVEMEASDFYAYFAPVKGAERLAEFAKLDAASDSWYEAQANLEQTDELSDLLGDLAQGLTEKESLQGRIESLLLDTGRFTVETARQNARLVSESYASLLERFGDNEQAVAEIQQMLGNLQVEYKQELRKTVDSLDFEINRIREVAARRREAQERQQVLPLQQDMLGGGRRQRQQRDRSPKPVTSYLSSIGGIRRGGPAAAELAAIGVTPKTHPRLFSKNGRDSLDNIPLSEVQAAAVDARPDATGNYADPQWWYDTLAEEAAGRGQLSAEQQAQVELDAYDSEVLAFLSEQGIDIATASNGEVRAALSAPRELFQAAPPVESEAFNRWFGDSKVVDADGNPLVVYHGSKADITDDFQFDTKKIGANATAEGYGFYFTTDRDTAQGYKPKDSGSLTEAYLNIKKPMPIDQKPFSSSVLRKIIRRMVEMEIAAFPDEIADYKDSFLSNFTDTYSTSFDSAIGEVANVIESGNDSAIDQISELANVMGDKVIAPSAVREITGYDGVVSNGYSNMGKEGGTIYVAWFPEQIKSVNNRGTFDPHDPRILYQITQRFERSPYDADADAKAVHDIVEKYFRERPLFADKKKLWSVTNGKLTQRVFGRVSSYSPESPAIFLDSKNNAYEGEGTKKSPLKPADDSSVEKAKKIYSKELLDSRKGVDDYFRQYEASANELAQYIDAKGVDVEVVHPDATESRYVYFTKDGRQYKIRFSRHMQPDEGGKIVGGYSREAQKRYPASDLSIDPSTRLSVDSAKLFVDDVLSGAIKLGDSDISFDAMEERNASYRAKSAAIDESSNKFQMMDDNTALGSFQIRGGIPVITLTEKANLSTFLHEMGHAYVETLRRLARVDARAKADFDTLARAAGAEGAAFTVAQEERLAEMFESYLMTGRAPSLELRDAFRRFKAWMLRVYRSILDRRIQVPREVSEVFDRMLATDEQIEQMRKAITFKPDQQIEQLLTEAQRKRYMRMMERQVAQAKETLLKRALRDLAKRETEWYKEARAKVEDEMRVAVESTPVYRLLDAVAADEVRLNSKDMRKQFGEGARQYFPRKAYAADGTSPDAVAELYGFSSAEAMVLAVANAEKKKDAIQRLTDQEMIQRFGDLVLDGSIEREALEALHNQGRSDSLYFEAQTLAERSQQRIRSKQELAAAARDRVGVTPVESLNPYLYYRAEVRAARDAARYLRANNFVKAAEAKKRELMSHFLYKESAAAQRRVDKALKGFRALAKPDRKIAQRRDIDFVNAARAVLARYGIGSIRFDVTEWMRQVAEEDPVLLQSLQSFIAAAMGEPKNYRKLTVDEFASLRDAVENVLEAAKSRREAEIEGRKVNRDQMIAEMVEAVQPFLPDAQGQVVKDKTKLQNFVDGVRGYILRASRMEPFAEMVDGEKPGAWTRFYRMMKDAEVAYEVARQGYTQRLTELLRPHAARLHQGRIQAPELGKTPDGKDFYFDSKAQLLGAMLHTGNLSSLEKLVKGRRFDPKGWARFVLRAMETGLLTKEDMDIVQAMWDMAEELKPAAQRTYKQLFGHRFDEVKAIPVWTPWGYYRGGYWPAKVDSTLNADAKRREDEAELNQEGAGFMLPSAEKGFTKKREDRYAAPLSFDLGMAPQHINEVLRFVHLTPAVRLATGIALNKQFRSVVDDALPGAISEIVVPFINRVNSQLTAEPVKSRWAQPFAQAARFMRSSASMQAVALNIPNALQTFTNIPAAVERVGGRELLNAVAQFTGSPLRMLELGRKINDKSDFMRTQRGLTFAERPIDEYYRIIEKPSSFKRVRDFVQSNAFILDRIATSMIDYALWLASYQKVLNDPANRDMDSEALERKAIAQADSDVRIVQGSHSPADASAIESGSPFYRLFTMFSTYFNSNVNNLGYGTRRILMSKDSNARKTARALKLWLSVFLLPTILSTAIYQYFYGVEDDDDDGSKLDDFVRGQVVGLGLGVFARVPVMGSIGNAAINALDDKPYNDQIQISPAIGMAQKTIGAFPAIANAIAGDGDQSKAVRDGMTAVGFLSGLPLGQISKPVAFAVDVAEGDSNPRNMSEWIRGGIAGRLPRD